MRLPMRRQQGLTMIEVLAAMVIFSAGAVVLFGWIGQTADRLGRLGAEQTQLFADLTAIEFLRSLNPMQQPVGVQSLGTATVRWEADPVGSESQARTGSGGPGIYVVQLYRTKVEVEVAGGRSRHELYLAGWRQTRSARGTEVMGVGIPSPAPAR